MACNESIRYFLGLHISYNHSSYSLEKYFCLPLLIFLLKGKQNVKRNVFKQTLYECNITLCIYSPLRNSFERVASNNRVTKQHLSRNNTFLITQPRIISYFNSFILIWNEHVLMIVFCITISIVINIHSMNYWEYRICLSINSSISYPIYIYW